MFVFVFDDCDFCGFVVFSFDCMCVFVCDGVYLMFWCVVCVDECVGKVI